MIGTIVDKDDVDRSEPKDVSTSHDLSATMAPADDTAQIELVAGSGDASLERGKFVSSLEGAHLRGRF